MAVQATPRTFGQANYSTPYTFTNVAGLAGSYGTNDGTGSAAQFRGPSGVAVDSTGNVYVADTGNNTIRRITPASVVTTLAGMPSVSGTNDGAGSAARFNQPNGVAVDNAGNIYVADTSNHTIRKVTPTGVVTTLAGLAGVSGTNDGTGSTARFYLPFSVAVDSADNVYVADTFNYSVRKMTPEGVVTTLARLAGAPAGVAVDTNSNVYVADHSFSTIQKVTPAGAVTTLAGLAGTGGSTDGTNSAARFSGPEGVAVDSARNVYVADWGNNTIRKVTSAGVVTTLAGLPQFDQFGSPVGGSANGTGSAARFNQPFGVAVDSVGNVYVADYYNSTIRKGWPSSGETDVVIRVQPLSQTVVFGANVTLNVTATGAGQLSYQWQRNEMNVAGATSSALTLDSVEAAHSGGYSVVVWNAYGSVVSDTAYLAVLTDGADGNQPPQVSAPTTPARPPAVDSLVVVTHGFEPQIGGDIEWVNTMANAIQQNLTARGQANWQVIPFQWRQSAGPLPEQALINGWILGGLKGKQWAQYHWQHVHLIGHSAGSAFIEAAARKFRQAWPDTVVHCTFLDPYLSVVRIGDEIYGQSADWSDCYLAQDWSGGFTRGKLAHAHNVDVSWLDANHKMVAYGDGHVAFSSHVWPHDFYLQSILATAPACAGDYGFGLSLEANGWSNRWSYVTGQEPTIPCGPLGAVTNPDLLRVEARLIVESLQHALSSLGASLLGNGAFRLSSSSSPLARTPGVPAWLAVGVTITNAVNFVQFESAFTGTNGAEGLMTVYWNTNEIGMVDERVTSAGLQTYRFALPGMITDGVYTLSFRLDSFTNGTSSITVTNVTTGFAGLDQPIKLDILLAGSNSAPVLKLTGASNFTYLVESSTNLLNWTPTALLLNTNGTALFADPAVTNSSKRFYRAVMP